MILTLVVAAARNNVIGKDNQLLWRLPNDTRYFKNVTWGMPVVMGRKTFESLGKPLAGRTNIVLTRNGSWKAEGVTTVKTMDDAVFLAKQMDVKELMVIGGGEIYKMVMPKANRIHLTRVEAEPEGDAWFPEIDSLLWKMVREEKFPADEKHQYAYSFQVWERR
ncbi:dihydrofolate reductase [Terrimonas sp. NA20]|uniref:Dihydrofolate reductase n=1 Tax=Terrimonas ginsenosidimutans TaxID=2908004 RepID=A0ABS9KY59_9BACT|nr:dihydrofolate reductase [Terrimonas ginsenosidimutans]MCG2617250.1 dihydrofolate reductase [Terrimonas ginsenosidimutans]